MLSEQEFKTKYGTDYGQVHEEEFLTEVSPEDKDTYEDSEILTGKNINGKMNKFNNYGKSNKGKKYNTIKNRMITSFNKFLDNKIATGEIDEIWERIYKSSKAGNFNFAKLLLERSMGKIEEHINIKTEGEIKIKLNIPRKFIKQDKK